MDYQENDIKAAEQPMEMQGSSSTMPKQPSATQKLGEQAEENPTTKRKVRRVGTITMGAALIITGVTICALLFAPVNDVLIIAKLSPLFLVALGIEVIVYTFKNNEVQLKYDFLSIFMCLFIIFGAVSASLVPTLFQYFGPERARIEQSVELEVVARFKEEKSKFPNLYTISTSIDIMGMRAISTTDGINALTPVDWLYGYAELNSITSKEEFAKASLGVYQKLSSLSPARVQLTCVSSAEDKKPYYTVEFRGKYINEPTIDIIMKQLNTYVIDDDGNSYVDEDDYKQNQAEEKMEQEIIAQDIINQ